jgi:cell wall-associated NlpC family hydrolase
MILNKKKAKVIVHTAKTYLGLPYSKTFDCVAFVREVYRTVGIEIPPLNPQTLPVELLLSNEQLEHHPVGHLLFLKDRQDPRTERTWTHVVIILGNGSCIHNSIFYGRKVIMTPLEEIYKRYAYVFI